MEVEASGVVGRGEVRKGGSPGRYLDFWPEELEEDKVLFLVVPGARGGGRCGGEG